MIVCDGVLCEGVKSAVWNIGLRHDYLSILISVLFSTGIVTLNQVEIFQKRDVHSEIAEE